MGLSRHKEGAAATVSDTGRSRASYEGKLGLEVSIDSGDNLQYRCAEGTVLHIYASRHAGATVAGWDFEDVGRVVDELAEKGVVLERYDGAGLGTDERGIAAFGDVAKVAYFGDPYGNTLSVVQGPRS